MDISDTRTSGASVRYFDDQLMAVIVRNCEGHRSTRLVCKSWRDTHDNSDNVVGYSYEKLLQLKTPKDATAAEGCLSWCRRLGSKLKGAHVIVTSTWWLLPCSPLLSWTALVHLILDFDGVPQLTSLEPLAQLKNLKQLQIWRMEGVSCLQPLISFVQLEDLDLQDCENITDLQPLSSLTSLHRLSVYGCGIDDLSSLSLTNLQRLSCCVPSCAGISSLVGLTSCCFHSGFEADYEMPDEGWEEFQHLPHLAELEVRVSYILDGFSCLQSSSLTSLDLWRPNGPFEPADFLGVRNLRELQLYGGCEETLDFSQISVLRKLEVLKICEYEGEVLHLSTLTSLSSLTGLSCIYCSQTDTPVDLSVLVDRGVQVRYYPVRQWPSSSDDDSDSEA